MRVPGRASESGGDAQSVRCLLAKDELMAFFPRSSIRKLGMLAHVCTLSAREALRSLGFVAWLASLAYLVSIRIIGDPVSKAKVKNYCRRYNCINFWPAHAHMPHTEN